ncbi:glucuronyl esterase domain-containing protein [Rhodohalobacter sp. 8-1]|uniref:glucuronyl esterase domain-containing protein n=1 Tax=Rhodohalobacter sp. 8-1 TaxID=3131972 RepID=UPI0030EDE593
MSLFRTIIYCALLFLAAVSCTNNRAESPAALPVAMSAESGQTSSNCPEAPDLSFSELDSVAHLPNPFSFSDGSQVSRMDHWNCRRDEIGQMAQQFELGEKPSAPESVTGSFENETLRLTIEHQGRTISFNSEVILPSGGQAPYPAIIGMGRSFLDNDQLDSLGVALINFPNSAIAEQMNASSRGNGLFYDLYGSDHPAGALMAWAWGVSRVIDLLETVDSPIDTERLGVTGCSRNGKGALIAGAFDERIALTIPQESGAGGAASWRISDTMLENGQNVQTLRQIVGENVWLRESFSQFSESVEKLPFDHHEVMGMVAPRGLLVIEHSGIDWLGPKSTYGASLAAREVWTAMGVPQRMGFSQVSGHNHCQLPDSQKPHVAAFVETFLLNNPAQTNIFDTDASFSFENERWIPWSTPGLR